MSYADAAAFKILIGAKGSHFDPDLVDRFVECIGIYPAGSIAELSSKEIAIVLPSPHQLRDTPKVLVVRDQDKKPCPEKMIDLSLNHKDPNGQRLTIKHLISDDAFAIDLSKYHELGSREAG